MGHPFQGTTLARNLPEGGVSIVNGAGQDEVVSEDDLRQAAESLGLDWDTIAGEEGHFYRFAGQQNPSFNDGTLFTSIVLPSEAKNRSGSPAGYARVG